MTREQHIQKDWRNRINNHANEQKIRLITLQQSTQRLTSQHTQLSIITARNTPWRTLKKISAQAGKHNEISHRTRYSRVRAKPTDMPSYYSNTSHILSSMKTNQSGKRTFFGAANGTTTGWRATTSRHRWLERNSASDKRGNSTAIQTTRQSEGRRMEHRRSLLLSVNFFRASGERKRTLSQNFSTVLHG